MCSIKRELNIFVEQSFLSVSPSISGQYDVPHYCLELGHLNPLHDPLRAPQEEAQGEVAHEEDEPELEVGHDGVEPVLLAKEEVEGLEPLAKWARAS